jgi:hypothetical protein
MTEAARTSKTLVNFYQTTGRYNPEDSHLTLSYFDKFYVGLQLSSVYLLICGLLTSAVSTSDYISSNVKMINVK